MKCDICKKEIVPVWVEHPTKVDGLGRPRRVDVATYAHGSKRYHPACLAEALDKKACSHRWDISRPMFVKGDTVIVRVCTECEVVQTASYSRMRAAETQQERDDLWKVEEVE
jgi:hypothetical protein